MTQEMERLLERLQSGWRPVVLEIDPAVPQRTLVEWSMVPASAEVSAMKMWGTLLNEIADLEKTWMTEPVLWIDPGLSWALCEDGFYWLQAEVVTRRHGVMSAAACFDGTRIPVRMLCSYVVGSTAADDMYRDYPSLTPAPRRRRSCARSGFSSSTRPWSAPGIRSKHCSTRGRQRTIEGS